ncbi:MAG: hypothetical protein ACOH5I_07985 [Oligoflexus sp.]
MIQWLITQVQGLFMDKEFQGNHCDLNSYYEHQFMPQKASMVKPTRRTASEYSRSFRKS